MLFAITLLFLFQLAGEAISLIFNLPIPGPVIGMALLFAALALRGGPGIELRETAQNLLSQQRSWRTGLNEMPPFQCSLCAAQLHSASPPFEGQTRYSRAISERQCHLR